jgi:hypothetical protein
MGAPDLLLALSEMGINILANGNLLLLRPAKALTSDMRTQIAKAKTELLNLAPRTQWTVHVPGRDSFGLVCPQGCTRDELIERYPQGTTAEATHR